jgi:hypothetical protein
VFTKLPLLFPDASGTPEITAAERQTVAGYNVRLDLTLSADLKFSVTLWVDVQQQIHLTAIAPPEDSVAIPGGWRWQDPKSLTDEDTSAIKALLAKHNGFDGAIADVLAVRTQVVSGKKEHVIFTRSDGSVNAVVTTTNHQEQTVNFFKGIKE